MNHHNITARCDRCGTTIELNPIQLVTHPLCIPAGHAWATFVRAHMKCGNTETLTLAPLAPTPAVQRPDVISAPQPLLPGGPAVPGGPEPAPHNLRIVGPKSGGGQQPIPMVTNRQQPITQTQPQTVVTHPPSPSAAQPAGGAAGAIAKQSATIFMPDGSQYDASAPPPSVQQTGAPGAPAVQPVVAKPEHRIIGPYEWGPLEGAELTDPDVHGVFTLTIDSTLMIERTTPALVAATTNDQPLQIGPDPRRYTLQFTPGKATLSAPGTRKLSLVGRRLLKYNGQPWVDAPPAAPPPKPEAPPSTLLSAPKAPPEPPTEAAPPELEAPADELTEPELEAPPASPATIETTATEAPAEVAP